MMEEEAKKRRATDLLALARRSRLKWIGEASDNIRLQNKGSPKEVALSLQTKIPAASCVQSVLTLLSDIVADGEVEVDVHTLALGLPEEEDFQDDILLAEDLMVEDEGGGEEPRKEGRKKPYDRFLDNLRRPQAVPIVKALQQFVSRFEAKVRANLGSEILGSPNPLSRFVHILKIPLFPHFAHSNNLPSTLTIFHSCTNKTIFYDMHKLSVKSRLK